MIYPPSQREPRSRGRMNPSREVALVVVAVALLLALLFPIAFPGVPVPHLPTPDQVAVAPPTPISMPQPEADGTPGLTAGAGESAGTAAGTGTPGLPTPFDLATPFAVMPTDDPYALPGPTAADRFSGGLPTRAPRATRDPATDLPSAYPGLGASATPATAVMSATPAGTVATVTVTATAGSGTPSATAGTVTATATPTVATSYP